MEEKVKQEPIPGVAGSYTEEELKENNRKLVEEKLEIIAGLNKFGVPIQATIHQGPQSWTIRNKAFWQALKGRDESIVKFMNDYLTPET